MTYFLKKFHRDLDRWTNRYFSFEAQWEEIESVLIGRQLGMMSSGIRTTHASILLTANICEKICKEKATEDDFKELHTLCKELSEDIDIFKFYREQNWI